MGPTWGPPGSCWPQMGPMLASWTLLSGYVPFWSCMKQVHQQWTLTWIFKALVRWIDILVHTVPDILSRLGKLRDRPGYSSLYLLNRHWWRWFIMLNHSESLFHFSVRNRELTPHKAVLLMHFIPQMYFLYTNTHRINIRTCTRIYTLQGRVKLYCVRTATIEHFTDIGKHVLLPRYGAFDLGLAVSVPLPIVTGIFVLLWFQSRLT